MKISFDSLLYKIYERRLWSQIKEGIERGDRNHPKHIAIIMDGNRRFAKKRNLPAHYGHYFGRKKLLDILTWLWELKIQYVSLFAFSTENINRNEKEVRALMKLFIESFKQIIHEKEFQNKNIQVKTIGRIGMLPLELQEAIKDAEESTKNNTGPTLVIAIGYGGRAEMIDAIRLIAKHVQDGTVKPEDINEMFVEKHLYTNGIPDPDIIIRTSGEERLSGFLLWQAAYSELYFTDVYFPEFRKIDLWRAIRTYQKRQRRFGK